MMEQQVVAKWIQRLIDRGVPHDVIQARIEKRRAKEREWAILNKEKKAANKRAYIQRKKEALAKPFKVISSDSVIKSAYRANWKEAPVYYCPVLTYRGMR